jgi:outer membrane autotransporter protein
LAGDLYVDVTDGNTGATALAVGGTISNVIMTSSGITGAFASVTDNSALFDFTAVTNGNAVDLSITGSSVTAVSAVNTTGLSPAAGAAAVFDTLISDGTSGDMQTVVTALGTLATDAAVAKAVYQTLPLFTGATSAAGAAATGAASSAITGHLAEMDAGATSGLGLSKGVAWASPLGGWAHQSELDGSAGYDAKLYGMIAGADAEMAPDLRAGLAFAYTQSRLADVSDIISNKMTVDSYQAFAYGTWDVAEDVRLRGSISGGRNQFDGTRQIAFSTLSRTAESSYEGYSFTAGSSAEKRFRLADALTFTPSVSLRYGAAWDDGYAETGANALNLQVEDRHSQNLLSGVDGRFDYMLANGVELSATAGLAYDLLNNRSRLTVAYQGASTSSFQVEGPNGSPWTGHAGVGVLMKLDSGVDVSAAYTLGAGDGLSSHTAGLTAKLAF